MSAFHTVSSLWSLERPDRVDIKTGLLEFQRDILPYLETVHADCRTYNSKQIRRLRRICTLHLCNRLADDLRYGSPPSAMDCSCRLLHRIIQKNRYAVGSPHSDGYARKIGDHRIIAIQLLRRDVCPIHYRHLHIMDLVHLQYRTRQSLIPSYCSCTDIRMDLVINMYI